VAASDTELIKRFLKGDESSFEEIVFRYEKKVYSLCLCYTGNREDALDLTQETFIRIYRFLPGFRFDASFSTWIYRLANNTCLDFLRKQKKVKYLSLDNPVNLGKGGVPRELGNNGDDVSWLELEKKELRQEVHEAFNKLPLEQKEVLVLKEFQGLKYDEIAAILKIPIGTVKSRIRRGRLQLKTIFSQRELLTAENHLKKQGEVCLNELSK